MTAAALTSIAPCNSDGAVSVGDAGAGLSSSAGPEYGALSTALNCASCDGLEEMGDGKAESSMRRTAESVLVTVTRCWKPMDCPSM